MHLHCDIIALLIAILIYYYIGPVTIFHQYDTKSCVHLIIHNPQSVYFNVTLVYTIIYKIIPLIGLENAKV